MADPMRVRATESGGVVDVKILMKHDMETGQRKDDSFVAYCARCDQGKRQGSISWAVWYSYFKGPVFKCEV